MGQLQSIVSDITALGYQIIALSPDRPEKLRQVLEKTTYDYTLVSDSKMAAAKALGIAFEVDEKTMKLYKGYGIDLEDASGEKHHLLPVPSVFLLDKNGRVQFTYVNPNYQVRIPPEVVLAAARAGLAR